MTFEEIKKAIENGTMIISEKGDQFIPRYLEFGAIVWYVTDDGWDRDRKSFPIKGCSLAPSALDEFPPPYGDEHVTFNDKKIVAWLDKWGDKLEVLR